jgi:hypothetical protein
MATSSRKPAKSRSRSKLMKAVVDHPVAAAGIAGAAVMGAVLVKKAVTTAAQVVTLKAVAKGMKDVARGARAGKGGKTGKGRARKSGARKAGARKKK